MHYFDYRDGALFAEDVDLTALAETVGTPFYVYSAATLRRHVRVLRDAFAGQRVLIAYAMKALSNQAVLTTNANKLKASSQALPSWFPKGSGPESGVKTDAKAEVWSDAAGFAAAANKFQIEAAKFQELATAGDVAGMKAQSRVLGGTCKGCHDKYRVPEKK